METDRNKGTIKKRDKKWNNIRVMLFQRLGSTIKVITYCLGTVYFGWLFNYILHVYSRQLALPLNLLFKLYSRSQSSMVGLIAFNTAAALRCKLGSTLSHPLIISKEKHSKVFFSQSLRKRELNPSYEGKSSAQRETSQTSQSSPKLQGFSAAAAAFSHFS